MFWFHATRRTSAAEYLKVLNEGCFPPPNPGKTQQLELKLQIVERSVYCYLGRALEQFGEFCVSVARVMGPPADVFARVMGPPIRQGHGTGVAGDLTEFSPGSWDHLFARVMGPPREPGGG
jgi:hypothetical protein